MKNTFGENITLLINLFSLVLFCKSLLAVPEQNFIVYSAGGNYFVKTDITDGVVFSSTVASTSIQRVKNNLPSVDIKGGEVLIEDGYYPMINYIRVKDNVVLHGRGSSKKPFFNKDEGFWEVELDSEYESGPTKVSILLPDNMPTNGEKLPVLYILPVIIKIGEYGDGLIEAKKANLSNKYGIICVRPCFSSIPWYGDHATNPKIRHESYLLKLLVPLIDSLYPTQANAEGRWLLGFSKSGWGAFTLLMRNPDIFGYAAAWDVPFMLDGEDSSKNWGPMGLQVNFGTKEKMQQSLPTKLAEKHSAWLSEKIRLVVGVGKFWESQSIGYHNYLNELKIPHVYRPDLVFKHRWDTGWFTPLVEDLITIAN